jgi:resuscitation-promoting factor RpfB
MKLKITRNIILALAAVILLVATALVLGTWKHSYTLLDAGEEKVIQASGFTVGQVLRSGSIAMGSVDVVTPSLDQVILFNRSTIEIKRAIQILILDGEKTYTLQTVERKPADLLAEENLTLSENDQLLENGTPIDPQVDLAEAKSYVLQIKRAVSITLTDENGTLSLTSSAATLGQALWQKGLRLKPEDDLTPQMSTLLDHPVTVKLKYAVLLNITVDGNTIQTLSAANTVGEALVDANIALQTLDYSDPPETSSLPGDGNIQVTRVREEVVLEKTNIPFEVEYQPDPNTDLDQRSLLQAGKDGIQVTRVRVRYEDGVEISRVTDAEWQAQAPQTKIIGYGTNIVIQTAVVDGVTITYWRSLTVYATSYSPCTQGYDYCTTSTASGTELKKGIVAVIVSWYLQMKGQQIFVPGYGTGTILDTEGGIPGINAIDLGFSENDFEVWHGWVTIYFLTPVPDTIPWILE